MKAPILSFYEPEVQGRGTIMEEATPTFIKILDNFYFQRLWRPSEVDELKNECFISNFPISESQNY